MRGCGLVPREGEGRLIKDNMTRDNDPIGRKIEAPVAFVIGGVTEEGTEWNGEQVCGLWWQ
jgi:hypothetical protein